MKHARNVVVAVVALLSLAAAVGAQPAGNWQKVHGRVDAVQGSQLTLKADDGRVLTVDMSQVSQSVQKAMRPGVGATLTGFAGDQPDRFSARYIVQDNAGPTGSNSVVTRVLPLIPQFLTSDEFRGISAGLQANEAAAKLFVTQLYQGFLHRAPTVQERGDWASFLLQSKDVGNAAEFFVKSPEYAQRNRTEEGAIRDLYEGLFGRAASADEVRAWQQRIAQK
jgi:hypothetical protein